MANFDFPEVWQNRVHQNLTDGTASFLDGIAEIERLIIESGEDNLVHIPITAFTPDVLINNKNYPIDVQNFTSEGVTVKLDKFTTKATSVTDDQIIGANYSKIDAVTKAHVNAINVVKYKKAIHALAPDANTAQTPIVTLKGAECTYEDLIELKKACDKAKINAEGRRLVLCDDHLNSLLKDRNRFGDHIVDYEKGMLKVRIAGFKVYTYQNAPMYVGGVKLKYGEVSSETAKAASVVFWENNVAKKTGLTKQYFSDAKDNPTTQQNLLNYRHYFLTKAIENKYMAALI